VTIPPTIVPIDGQEPEGSESETTGPVTPATRSSSRRWWILGGVAVAVAALVAASMLIQLPSFIIEPGSVRPAEQRIDVQGAKAYDSKGDILFTTVYIVRATPMKWLQAKFDSTLEMIPESVLYPGGDTKAGQQRNQVQMDLSKLIATKEALEYLGYSAEFTGDGALVRGLSQKSPSAGRLSVGDVIVAVDGDPVRLVSDIGPSLEDRKPGDTVPVRFTRKGVAKATEVTLGSAPDSSSRPVLGVEVGPSNPQIDSPVTVEVDSGKVSGPSAGLAWTLAILDRLTPGSLTNGRDVAVTGEILPDGRVGPIGGVVQKVTTVRRAGIRTFLYPASTPLEEQRAMKKMAGGEVDLRPVETLDEAVKVLAPQGLPRQG